MDSEAERCGAGGRPVAAAWAGTGRGGGAAERASAGACEAVPGSTAGDGHFAAAAPPGASASFVVAVVVVPETAGPHPQQMDTERGPGWGSWAQGAPGGSGVPLETSLEESPGGIAHRTY